MGEEAGRRNPSSERGWIRDGQPASGETNFKDRRVTPDRFPLIRHRLHPARGTRRVFQPASPAAKSLYRRADRVAGLMRSNASSHKPRGLRRCGARDVPAVESFRAGPPLWTGPEAGTYTLRAR